MKRILFTLALVLASIVPLAASELHVTVNKEAISLGGDRPLLYTTFADDPLRVDLLLVVVDLPTHPLPPQELAALRGMVAETWLHDVQLIVRDRATNRTLKTINGAQLRPVRTQRTEEGPHASNAAFRKEGLDYVTYRASLVLPALSPGDYALEARLQSLHNTDTFAVSTDDEPHVRAAHLERAAAHAQSFAEYERIQKDRLAATPGDATILTNLGYRAMREGTLDQATTYFERAIAVMQENVARYQSSHPTASGAVAGIGDRRIQELRGLQMLLPDFFRQRDRVRIEQEQVGDHTRWVLKDRVSGRVLKAAP